MGKLHEKHRIQYVIPCHSFIKYIWSKYLAFLYAPKQVHNKTPYPYP